jgi:hypothetical protein
MSVIPVPSAAVVASLRGELRDFVHTTESRAPLYAQLAEGIAEADEVLAILAEAPETSRLPVTLFAAIHSLLLAAPSEPLAAWYPNLSATPRRDDPLPALRELCRRRRDELVALVRTRVPQTNEIGRSAPLLIGLSHVARQVGPLAHLDVGASAGLNLITDHLSYSFGGRVVGDGPISLHCDLRGPSGSSRVPESLPVISSRLGLDANPVNLADPDQVRWLEACVWPDQADRFERLRLALRQASELHLRLLAGDAVDDLADAVAALGPGHRVITTSWVLNYLGADGQRSFLTRVAELGAHGDLSLILYEAPNLTPGLEWPTALAAEDLSVLRVFGWRDGHRSDTVLAKGHPHGYWLTWLE